MNFLDASKQKMSEKFNFKWHTYHTHTNELLAQLYKSSNFSDVTLICDDNTQFKVHKFVLSACSSFFRSILSNNVSSPYIYLRGLSRVEMESLLQFMYLGETTFYQDRMNEFLNVAKDLQVKEIMCNFDPGKYLVTEEIQEEDLSSPNVDNDLINDIVDIEVQSQKNVMTLLNDIEEEGRYGSLNDKQTSQLKTKAPSLDVERRHVCNKCNTFFSDRPGLTKHVNWKHKGIRHPCPKCPYKATQITNLTRHIKSQHKELILEFC